MTFDAFVGIDWSGARGPRLKNLQVAVCDAGDAAPRLVANPAGGAWRRSDLVGWLARACARGERLLVGLDFSFTLPFVDRGAYFPGLCRTDRADAPQDARTAWSLVERVCAGEPDYYAGAFVAAPPWREHFRARGRIGARFSPRHKTVEAACAAQGLGHAESVFHLIGPRQVGLGSLSGMRVLHALGRIARPPAVWPFDPPGRVTLAEIYPRAFLRAAGHGTAKVRSRRDLDAVLRHYGSRAAARSRAPLSDDAADAIVTAAALRALHERDDLWQPAAMDETTRRTEGWIFGVA